MAKRDTKLVLLSQNIFPATGGAPFDGFVAVEGDRIAAVGPRAEAGAWTEGARVLDLGDKVVAPGFTDVHTFFSGWVLRSIGVDFTGARSDQEGVERIRAYREGRPADAPVFGHCWEPDRFTVTQEGLLDSAFPDVPVVIFTFDRDDCWMNTAAKERYGFTPEACYAEKI